MSFDSLPSNPLVDPIITLLTWLHDIAVGWPLPDAISPWAIALILVALLVKLVTYPLNATQMRSMRAMQELQPQLKELQEKYKGNREEMAAKQMELYKEHGVSPFGGCLPLLIQLPILFGLFRAIQILGDDGTMAGERFFWVPDLSLCEPSPLCPDSPDGMVLGFMAIPILVITMAATQFLYQRFMTPPSTDPQQQAMQSVFKWMPLFFAFLFARFSAGLVLYYTTFNIANLGQQAIMRRGDRKKDDESETEDDARGSKKTRAKETQETSKNEQGRKRRK